jgi:phosphatidylcholine synthase
VHQWRTFNIALMGLWAVLALLAIAQDLSPGLYVTVPLSLIAVYFFAAGLLRTPT